MICTFSKLTKSIHRDATLMLVLITATLVPFLFKFLSSSLWIDEFTSYWVIESSFSEVFRRSFEYQGQSPFYYLLLWLFSKLFGTSEIALRLLSIVSFSLTLIVFYKVSIKLFNKKIAYCAVCFLSVIDSSLILFSARPYGLGLLFFLLSILYLLKLQESKYPKFSFIYTLTLTLTVYCHYLLFPMITVHCLYILLKNDFRLNLKSKIFIYQIATFGMLLLPVIPHIISLRKNSSLYSFEQLPTLLSIIENTTYLPLAILFVFLTLFYLIAPHKIINIKTYEHNSNLIFLCGWVILPPLCLFLLSTYLDSPIFIQRYLIWQLPGLALLISILINLIQQPIYKGVLFLCMFALTYRIFQLSPIPIEDWKLGIKKFSEISTDSTKNTKKFLYSGLIESKNDKWLNDPEKQNYLKTSLRYYGFQTPVTLLPSTLCTNDNRLEFADKNFTSRNVVILFRRILIGNVGKESQECTEDILKTLGYKLKDNYKFNFVRLLVFRKEIIN